MRSLSPEYLDGLAFSPEDLAATRTIGAHRGKQELFSEQAPEALEALRRQAIVESVESSNRIERIGAPRARIEGLVERRVEPKNRSEQEIAGYRDALALVHESAEHMPFSPAVIQQIHQLVYRYHPHPGGSWKSTNNDIVDRAASGTVARMRFRTVQAVETPQAMDALCASTERAGSEDGIEPLILIPLAILDFLCIHPFRDGNGRVGRLLTTLLLAKSGYRVGSFVSMERIIEESKETYYEALEESSSGWHEARHDVLPWLRYFWGTLARAYREFEERADLMVAGTKSEAIRRAVARRLTPFAISEMEHELPHISREMIRLVLRELRDEGKILVVGKGRGSKWRKV